MNDKAALERAKEIEQTLIDSGDILRFGKRIIRAKDFFALPLEKQIELKKQKQIAEPTGRWCSYCSIYHGKTRATVNCWPKGRQKRTESKP